jgi:hypothetical protein
MDGVMPNYCFQSNSFAISPQWLGPASPFNMLKAEKWEQIVPIHWLLMRSSLEKLNRRKGARV